MKSRRAVLAAVLLLVPAITAGQAWTPPAGQGTMWMGVQTLHADAHLQGNGITAADIDMVANTAALGLDYGLTDRLALGMSVPYVTTRFNKGRPHVGSVVDDGRTHGTLTDLRAQLRYKAVDSSIVFTPTLAAIIPLRDYDTLGHAAPGKGVREYAAGFDVGHNVVSISPSLFVSADYQYTYVERIDPHVSVDRSSADFDVDYLVTSRLALRASTRWQHTHGGLNLPLAASDAAEHAQHHDQLARADFWHGTIGIGYGLTSTFDVFGSWSTVLQGVNSHRFRSWNAGVAWRVDRSRWHRTARQTVAALRQMRAP